MMLAPVDVVWFLLLGVIAGGFGGLLGLGGAVIMMPVLTLGFGLPVHLAIAVSLISNIFVSLTSVIGYMRRGLMHRRTVLIMNVGSIAGIAIGTVISLNSPASLIKVLFGLFLIVMILNAAMRKHLKEKEKIEVPEKINVPAFSVLGFCMGVLGAMLGLGGGTLAVPVQNSLLKVPLKNAIANSLGTIVVSASVGAVLFFLIGAGRAFPMEEALLTAAVVVPGSVAGAKIATTISDKIPLPYIKFIFYALLLYISYTMIKSGMGW